MPKPAPVTDWNRGALRGAAVPGAVGETGYSVPLYNPNTLQFIGWENPQTGQQMALPSFGKVPDYYQQPTQAQAAAPAGAPAATPSYYPAAGGGWVQSPTGGWTGGATAAGGATQMANGQVNFMGRPASYNPQTGELSFGQAGSQWVQPGQKQVWRESDGSWSSFDPTTGELNNTAGGSQWLNTQPAVPQDTTQPETRALQQMAQIDPQTEALRQGLAGSYLGAVQQAQAPTAAQFQSYLNMYKQLDPTGAAAREALGRGVSSEYALGSQLDPGTIREVTQGVRAGQAARGNVYGTPQLVAETMARGQMGEQRKQQRMSNLASYLQAGISPGDVALNLYRQQQDQLRASQGAALGYLGSGQTPYAAGASYYDRAQQAAAMAAQGGPQYNPQALGQNLTGSATQFPQYGLNIGQQANQWYNSLAAYGGGGGPTKNRGASAATGALSGAMSGAAAGTAASPGVGTLIGAGLGAALGGAAGYAA